MSDSLRDKMVSLNDFILDAERSVLTGKMVDMTGIDKDVAVICKQAVSLPPEQARDIQPVMAELIGNLERLSLALKDYRNTLKKK